MGKITRRPRKKKKNGKDALIPDDVKPGPEPGPGTDLAFPHPYLIERIEDEQEFDRHMDGVRESLAPEGYLEETLTDRLALLIWELDRVSRVKTALANHRVARVAQRLSIADAYLSDGDEDSEPDPRLVLAHQLTRITPAREDLEILIRYESRLHNQMLQTLDAVETLQARRRGERVSHARVSVHGGG